MKHAPLFAAAIAALILPAAAVSAQDATPQAHVKVKDLDLTTQAGRKTAEQRLNSSANGQCGSGDSTLQGRAQEDACKRELVTKGRSQIAVAAAESENERLAEARRLAQVSTRHRIVRRTVTTHHVVHHRPVKHRRVVHHVVHKTTVTHTTATR